MPKRYWPLMLVSALDEEGDVLVSMRDLNGNDSKHWFSKKDRKTLRRLLKERA